MDHDVRTEITPQSWLLDAAFRGSPCAWYVPSKSNCGPVFSEFLCIISARAIKSSSKSQRTIWLINGGRIDFWSMGDHHAGRGRAYKRVVIDEFDLEMWQLMIRPTLVDLAGEALILQ